MTGQMSVFLIIIQLSSILSIYNGQQCKPEYNSFMVELIGHKSHKETLKCSGTLIKLDRVLTAAHCVQKFKGIIFAEPTVVLHKPKGELNCIFLTFD